jgi:ligand-binding SRPBCC domain-containing protein
MAAYSIKTVQKIPASLKEAWDFFSNPGNLQAITPGNMGFKIISRHNHSMMYPGQIIEYKVRPLKGISVYWMTEITNVKEGKYFIDEQRMGPFRFWHHEHHFGEIDGGVEMTDIIHYKNPFGLIGKIANGLFVRNQLNKIFEYRYRKVEELFGKWKGQQYFIEID